MKDNAWFEGFAPRAPRKSWWWRCSSTASTDSLRRPIVRDVLKAYFDKKERLTQLQQNQTRTVAALRLGVPAGASGLALPR